MHNEISSVVGGAYYARAHGGYKAALSVQTRTVSFKTGGRRALVDVMVTSKWLEFSGQLYKVRQIGARKSRAAVS